MYSLTLWLQAKRVLADRRHAAEKAKAKRRRIECQRESQDERLSWYRLLPPLPVEPP